MNFKKYLVESLLSESVNWYQKLEQDMGDEDDENIKVCIDRLKKDQNKVISVIKKLSNKIPVSSSTAIWYPEYMINRDINNLSGDEIVYVPLGRSSVILFGQIVTHYTRGYNTRERYKRVVYDLDGNETNLTVSGVLSRAKNGVILIGTTAKGVAELMNLRQKRAMNNAKMPQTKTETALADLRGKQSKLFMTKFDMPGRKVRLHALGEWAQKYRTELDILASGKPLTKDWERTVSRMALELDFCFRYD